MDIEKFYRPDSAKLPKRTGKEFIDYQRKIGAPSIYSPIPIRDNEPFDRLNPVWNSMREINEYARRIPGWHCDLDRGYAHSETDNERERWLGSGTDARSSSKDWSWGYNLNEALALFDRGWHEGFEAVRAGMENAARAAMAKAMPVEDLDKHVTGSIVDVPAFIRGEPEAMWEFQDSMREVMHLEVEVDSFVVSTTDADEYLYRGVAIMSAVMALRRMGVFVTLYQREKGRTEIAIPASIKKFGRGKGEMRPERKETVSVTATLHLMNQDLTENLSEVLLALCHPGWHRKVYFHSIASAWGTNFNGLSYQGRDTDDFIPKQGSGKIVIPGHFHQTHGTDDLGIDWGNTWASPKAAEMMVENMLKCAARTTGK